MRRIFTLRAMPPTPRSRDFFNLFAMRSSTFRGFVIVEGAQFFLNVQKLEICQTSKFQLRTTLGGHKHAKKLKQQNQKYAKLSQDHLPPEDGSVWLETLPASISGDSQHSIFLTLESFVFVNKLHSFYIFCRILRTRTKTGRHQQIPPNFLL